jgi:hypothetical protein
MRAGERKTGWTKPLPPPPGLWALNAPGLLLVGHQGIPGGGLEPFAVPTRLSSGQHSLDLTIWPRAGTPMALAAQMSPPRPGGRFGLARLERRSWGHDVSGTGRQTLGRMMLSITTMVPA